MNKKRRFASLAAALIILNGCDSVSTEDDPGSVADLCDVVFNQCVNPILQNSTSGQVGCASSSCHGFGPGHTGGAYFLYESPNLTELAFNFTSTQSFVNPASPAQSKLLAEPLIGDSGVASVGPHVGGDIFQATSDVCYQQLLTWVQTSNSASCAISTCRPPLSTPVAAAEVNACGI
ncbi:MAG: hypothetical protein AB8B89_03085 [Gammaproteobacteria bacterium]